MGFSRYESTSGKVGVVCPRCLKETISDISELMAYGGKENGVFLVVPGCQCGTQTILTPGVGIGSPGGHAMNCLANAVINRKQFKEQDAFVCKTEVVEERLKELRSKYESGDPRLSEFDGVSDLKWVSKGVQS